MRCVEQITYSILYPNLFCFILFSFLFLVYSYLLFYMSSGTARLVTVPNDVRRRSQAGLDSAIGAYAAE